MFPISELTLLTKGKGLKIIQIPPAKLKTREEYVVAMTAMGETDNLTIFTNKRHTLLKPDEHEKFIGERGRRGAMLSRNFRNVIRRSEEHTSELQSLVNLVCRLLLEKKKKKKNAPQK